MARFDDLSATGPSPSADGGDAAPGDGGKQTASKPFRVWLPSLGTVAQTLELLRKSAVSFVVIALLVVGSTFLVREIVRERVIIEPVVVQVDDAKGGLNSEAMGNEVSRHLAAIQRVGTGEWAGSYQSAAEPFAVEQSSSIISRPINLKEFGAPLNLTTSVGEIASALGVKHPTIKISIGSRRAPTGYTSSVTMVGDITARASCDTDNTPQGIDELVECVALSAMSFVDPKIAAAYVLSRERRICSNLDAGILPGATLVAREEIRIKNRRDRCAFEKTQALIARVLERGRADHSAWIPYVLGQIHMARAMAMSGIDRAQQLSEFDQAISRFAELARNLPDSAGALTTMAEAHVRKGVLMHEATVGMHWSEEPTSGLQWQLYLAESTFAEAEAILRSIPPQRNTTLAGFVSRLEAYLIYRQWMLMAHRRTRSGMITTAAGQPAELRVLGRAAALYRSAEVNGVSTGAFYVEWGNTLRALGDFDAAVGKYSRAADRDPTDITSRLNITVAYLDRVVHGREPSDPLTLLIGLGAAADYLSWTSSGGPYPTFTERIAAALGRSGYPEDGKSFRACMTAAREMPPLPDPDIARWRAAAELKQCIDQAIEQINWRVRSNPAPALRAAFQ